MTDNKYFFNSFKPKPSCLIPSRSQELVNVSVCCCSLCYFVVVVRLFNFVFYCETTARDSVATMWKNWLLQNNFSAHVRPERTKYKNRVVHVQYACTVLMMQFASRALYTVHCPLCTRKKLSILWAYDSMINKEYCSIKCSIWSGMDLNKHGLGPPSPTCKGDSKIEIFIILLS